MEGDALRREEELRRHLKREKEDRSKRERERWGSPPPWWVEQERRKAESSTRERESCQAHPQKGRFQPGGNNRSSPAVSRQPKQKQAASRPPLLAKGADASWETRVTLLQCALPKAKRLSWCSWGYGIPGQGFYQLDLATSREDDKASNSALVSVQTSQISSQLLKDELKNVFDENWHWQVKQLSLFEFAVVFPSKESLRFASKSGRLILPLNQILVSIKEEEVDPEASSVLAEVWLKLSGIPRKIRDPDILPVTFQMLGRSVEVDAASHSCKGPMRMKFLCRNPNKLRGSVEIFVHKIGYKIKIDPELPASAPKAPPVPHSDESHGDDFADPTIDEEEWERLGSRFAQCSPGAEAGPIRPNLRGSGDIFPALRILHQTPLLAPPVEVPLAATVVEVSDDELAPLLSAEVSPFKTLKLSALSRTDLGWVAPLEWDVDEPRGSPVTGLAAPSVVPVASPPRPADLLHD
ncbi:uncharacterized protein LOC112270666 [Brachypodium distachyon]|uniref:uncharacterized protein LOC112270666 n=1 Tax=Brachypodium distachyon TaxID=15368 RepID=UPI0005300AB1|nr:uncharacterized protein LOC112270666 [Brachypodium distachyon]|eukprot:XP_024314400.1 uncharacterized protein LOC112270666 [Brachypodium distachyon]